MSELITEQAVTEQLIYIARVLLAAICGGSIGMERQKRQKIAGVRTHVIVAVAAALMMLVSKYGFIDVVYNNAKFDPSRVAAGVVTAFGFLGSGVIISRKNVVQGITTSAGLWGTVGIGISIGAGMYVIGIVTTILILIVEDLFDRKSKTACQAEIKMIMIEVAKPDKLGEVMKYLRRLKLEDYNVKKKEGIIQIIFEMECSAVEELDGMLADMNKQFGITGMSVKNKV